MLSTPAMTARNSSSRHGTSTIAIASIITAVLLNGAFISGCGGKDAKGPGDGATYQPDSGATAADGSDGTAATGTAATGTAKPAPGDVAMKPVTADTAGCARHYGGTINGTIPIVMTLCRVGDEFSGHYRYVRVGKDIPIQGHISANGAVIIYEWGDGPKKQTGNFLGRFVDAERIEGTWQTPKGDRSMPFILTRGVAPDGGTDGGTAGAWTFAGSWALTGGGGATFDLDLKQLGSRITGRHCATTERATRVDCTMDDGEPDTSAISIVGIAHGDTADVTFTSSYGLNDAGKPVTGKARIIREGALIHWKIVGEPDGEEYLPFDARLKRSR